MIWAMKEIIESFISWVSKMDMSRSELTYSKKCESFCIKNSLNYFTDYSSYVSFTLPSVYSFIYAF
jgi:hypothetical protein